VKGIRVLHVVNSLDAGGMENGVVNIVRGLSDNGFEMQVACLERRGVFADRLGKGARVSVLGKKKGFSPKAAAKLAWIISRQRPQVLHTHNLGPLIYGALATFGGKTARILHGEHSALTSDERTERRLGQRRSLYGYCSAVHTVADATRAELQELSLPARELVSIPNGVDTACFQPAIDRSAARTKFGLPLDDRVIGLVGRFGPYKGHTPLIDAFETIAARFPRVRLLFVGGGGPLESQIQDRAKASSFSQRIHFTGYLSEPWIGYHALDWLIIPSTNEGMSNVALEAMASGVPVLANDHCGHEQVVETGESGLLRNLRDPEAMTAALAEILGIPDGGVDFAQNARTRVASEFSLARMLERYAHLYRALVAPSP